MPPRDDNRVRAWHLDPPPAGAGIWPHPVGHLTSHGASHYLSVNTIHIPHAVVRGRGTIRAGGAEYALEAGDLFILWPGVRVEYFDTPEDPWEFYWIHLLGEGAAAWCRACGFRAERPRIRPFDPAAAVDGFRRLYAAMEERTLRGACAVLARLYDICAACPPPGETGGEADEAGLAERALGLMESLLPTGANVEEIAGLLHVSRATLYREFRARMGRSPVEALTAIRLRRACELLRNTDEKIAVVSRACGFANEKYFLRRFRERTGSTPGAYRAKTGA